MHIKYNLTKNYIEDNIASDRDDISVASDAMNYYKIDRPCVISECKETEKGVLFYFIVAAENINGELVADFYGTYVSSRECIIELINIVVTSITSTESIKNDFRFSGAALRATLKRVYSCSDAYAYLSEGEDFDPIDSIGIFAQIIRYLDHNSLSQYVFASGFDPESSKKKILLIDEQSRDIYYACYPLDLGVSSNKDTAADRLVDYLMNAQISERNQLISLLSKYGKYAESSDGISQSTAVYSAFVEGDEELLLSIVHSYSTDMYLHNKPIYVEDGVSAVIRQSLRDRYVLKLIYDGYDSLNFQQLLEKNRPDIAFCNAFRAVDGLFCGDNAESYSIMLASRITSEAEDSDSVYDLVKAESLTVDQLMMKAENPMEFAMINAYNRVLVSLLKRVEDVTDVEEDGTDVNLDREEEKTSEALNQTESDSSTSDIANSADSIELERLKLISEMTAENYRQVYSLLFGSDYLNYLIELSEKDKQKNEVLVDFYKAKLCSLLSDYYAFKNELGKEGAINDNEALKLIVKEKYSDMLCYALEGCDQKGLCDVIEGYESELVDDRIFFPLLYSRACQLISQSGSCEFIDLARKTSQNEIIDTVLLAAKFASSAELLPQYFFIELEELVSGFALIEKYINGDIVFNASVHGTKYCGISLKLYINARQGENMDKVRFAAQNSLVINNFLADMSVEGFARVEISSSDENNDINDEQTDSNEGIFETVENKENKNNVESDVLVVVDEKKSSSVKKSPDKPQDFSARSKQEFDEPETYRVVRKNGNAEKMKFSIFALSALTIIALIIFILLTNFK